MEIVSHIATSYAVQHSTAMDDLLEEIEQYTKAHHPKQHMISGALQGQLLRTISHIVKPKTVLEIGTFTGYSALCLASGLAENGALHTIEIREEDAKTAQLFFHKSPWANQIKLHIGNAVEIIPTLEKNWDLIFLDADKVNYLLYYGLTLPYVNSGGIILADNVLFHGEVLKEKLQGKNAIAMDRFNKAIYNDKRVEVVMLTLRDGISIIRKL